MKGTKKSLTINGECLEYIDESESLAWANAVPITEDDAKKTFQLTKTLFDSIELKFSLAYGSLLGAIRDHGLIKGDEDIDIYIWQEDILWNNLIYLYNNGLKVCRAVPGEYYSFRVNDNAYIDVYVMRELKKGIWKNSCYSLSGLNTPKKYFKGYHTIDFLGCSCLCPDNPEALLEFWYGKDWRIPKKGHNFYYEVKSAYYWHWIVKRVYKFVAPLIKKK